jgi:hypothetical protein
MSAGDPGRDAIVLVRPKSAVNREAISSAGARRRVDV